MDNSRQEDSQWRGMLASQMRETELELTARFADIGTRLSNVMQMKKVTSSHWISRSLSKPAWAACPFSRPDTVPSTINMP